MLFVVVVATTGAHRHVRAGGLGRFLHAAFLVFVARMMPHLHGAAVRLTAAVIRASRAALDPLKPALKVRAVRTTNKRGRYAVRRADVGGTHGSRARARRQLLPTLPSDRYRAEVAEVVNLRLAAAMAGVPAGAVAAAEVSSTITRKAAPPDTYGFHGGFAYVRTVFLRGRDKAPPI